MKLSFIELDCKCNWKRNTRAKILIDLKIENKKSIMPAIVNIKRRVFSAQSQMFHFEKTFQSN
jgi:hypothetical protein